MRNYPNSFTVLGSLALVLALSCEGRADSWDLQTDNDNSFATTENELIHGSDQLHDLGALLGPAADEDWYVIGQKPFASYEVVVDSTSGDIGFGVGLQRIASDGSTVLQDAVSITAGLDYSVSLRWENNAATSVDDELILVESNSCTTDCDADDIYRIRAFETTYSIPRFNNSGTQITVLILQNPASYTIDGNIYFWDTTGSLLATSPFSLAAKATLVLNTSTVVLGSSGAITLSNDGRYGDLSGKTVTLEPATGFSFDTPMLHRPN